MASGIFCYVQKAQTYTCQGSSYLLKLQRSQKNSKSYYLNETSSHMSQFCLWENIMRVRCNEAFRGGKFHME